MEEFDAPGEHGVKQMRETIDRKDDAIKKLEAELASYKDKEIFTLDESIKHFNLEGIGKSPSKLDMSRILSMNEHYIKNIDENDLFNHLTEYCELYKSEIQSDKKDKIKKSLIFLKNKAKTLEDIFNNAQYIIKDEVDFNKDDLKLIDDKARKVISDFKNQFEKKNYYLGFRGIAGYTKKTIINKSTNFLDEWYSKFSYSNENFRRELWKINYLKIISIFLFKC